MVIHQSFCLPMFAGRDYSTEQLFFGARQIGYEATEIWARGHDFDKLAELAAAHRLRIATFCGHSSLASGLNDATQHERIERELRESIDIARHYGVPGVIAFSGNVRPGASQKEGVLATIRGLRRIAAYAEEKQVNVNLELLNTKVDHPGYEACSLQWGLEVCRAVNSPRVKLLYDIYHMQIMEGDVIRSIRDNIPWIGHFHTAGVPGRRDIDATQELNYGAICTAIADAGYGNFVGHEFRPKGDPLRALAAAFVTCAGQSFRRKAVRRAWA